MVLLIIGFILIATIFTHGADNSFRQKVAMIVRLDADASTNDVDSLTQFLKSRPYVYSLNFASAQDVYNEEMLYNAELLEIVDENPYSSEFDILLHHDYVNSDSINQIINQLVALSGVDSAYSSTEVVDNINYLMGKITLFLSILGIVMVVISVVLIFNTVNLVIYSRRFLIHTMKLVGARPSFIRRPFIVSATKLGIIAGFVASAAICALHLYTSSVNLAYLLFPNWKYTFVLCVILILLGMIFCSIAAYFATGRFIRYSYDSLYMK